MKKGPSPALSLRLSYCFWILIKQKSMTNRYVNRYVYAFQGESSTGGLGGHPPPNFSAYLEKVKANF